jgi:hypothetical protein
MRMDIEIRLQEQELHTQNYWGFGLYSLSNILETRKQRFGNWICFRPQVRGKTHNQSVSLERANPHHRAGPVRFTTAI